MSEEKVATIITKIYEDKQKRFFVYDNVLDTSLIENMVSESVNNVNKGEHIVRFAVVSNTHDNIDIVKPYKDFTDYEKEMFHKQYKDDNNFTLKRRDADIVLSYELTQTVNKRISDIIKQEYNVQSVSIEYASIIYYGPEYLMGRHVDGNPSRPRLCTAVLYCNEAANDDMGGDVIFYEDIGSDNITYKYKPLRNQLVVFDSENSIGIEHEVTEIKNWYRYVYRVYFSK